VPLLTDPTSTESLPHAPGSPSLEPFCSIVTRQGSSLECRFLSGMLRF
jgi:hypothetical protein